MKKEIFKVCALGLVAVTLVTGCGKENESTKKVTKSNEQEIVLDKESNVNEESNINIEEDINKESNSNKTEEKNSNVKTNKVVKVSLDQKDMGNKKIKMYINAVDANGKTVWTKDAFTYTDKGGTDFNDLVAEQGDKYFYYGDSQSFSAYDIQTGKIVWTNSKKVLGGAAIFKEYNNKLYVESGMGDYELDIFDLSNGKHLKKIELTKYLEKEESRFDFEEYYDLITSTMKVENNKITFEVHDKDDYGHDTGYVGTLNINLSNYEVTLKK